MRCSAEVARGLKPHYDFFFRPPRFFGTFAPDLRASDRPIAIACLRLFTFLPLRPLFSVPFFLSCIARFTFAPAFLPYLAMMNLQWRETTASAGAREWKKRHVARNLT